MGARAPVPRSWDANASVAHSARCRHDVATGSTLVADPFYTAIPELPRVVNTPSSYDVDDSAAVGQQTALYALYH